MLLKKVVTVSRKDEKPLCSIGGLVRLPYLQCTMLLSHKTFSPKPCKRTDDTNFARDLDKADGKDFRVGVRAFLHWVLLTGLVSVWQHIKGP